MADEAQPNLPSELPVVPLRGAVVLPMTVSPLGVSRTISVEAVNRALAGDRMILSLLQQSDADEPGPDDLYRVGTVCIIRQMAKAQGGMRVLVEGIARARAEFLQVDRGVMQALVKPLKERVDRGIEIDARVRRLQDLVDRALSLATGLSPDIKALISSIDDPAARRLPAGEPPRHEAGGQAEAARGREHRGQARRGRDGTDARDRGARAEGTDRIAGRERDVRRAAAVRAAPAAQGDPDRAGRRRQRDRSSSARGLRQRCCRSGSRPWCCAKSIVSNA